MTFRKKFSIFLLFIVIILVPSTSHTLTDIGSISISGRIKHLEGRVVAVNRRILVIKPNLVEIERKILFKHKIEDIVVDEGSSIVYLILKGTANKRHDKSKRLIHLVDIQTGEIVDSISLVKHPKAVEIDPLREMLFVLTSHKNQILLFDLKNSDIEAEIYDNRKIPFFKIYPEGGMILIVTRDNYSKQRGDDYVLKEKKRHRSKKDKFCLKVLSIDDGSQLSEYCFSRYIKAISVDRDSATAALLIGKGDIYILDLITQSLNYFVSFDIKARDIKLTPHRILITDIKRGRLLVLDRETGQLQEDLYVGERARFITSTGIYYLVSYKKGIRVFREDIPPEITGIEPQEVLVGTGDVELVIRGRWFMPEAEVVVDDVVVPTVYVSETELRATVPSSHTEITSLHMIKVRNPDGRFSNEVAFVVRVPEPYISTVVPIETDVNTGAMVLEVYGSGFLPDTKVYYDGKERPVSYIKETKLQMELLAEDTQMAGVYRIYAENQNYDGTVVRSNTFDFTVNNPVPVVTGITPSEVVEDSSDTVVTIQGRGFVAATEVYFNGQAITVESYTYTSIRAVVPAFMLTESGEYPLIVKNPPPGGGTSQEVMFTVTRKSSVQPLPEGSFGKQYEDLIPSDATIKAYDPERFSIITGLVKDRSGNPLSGVTISIHRHPEYGTAETDSTGRFSIPVEGGGIITVVYKKAGYITVHRKVYVPWNDIAVAEEIVMITEDPVSTTVIFDGNASTVITHRSSTVTDEYGSRSLTMVFTGDNRAFTTDKQGNEIELTTITVRATEFDIPESMPAKLPPTSAYTYAVELSVDGRDNVRFEKPVIIYVDNFIGFPVGEAVPVGYYDRERAVWVPSDNGVVVKLLDTDGDGVVDALDATGDGNPDDLNGNGAYSDEVKGLEEPSVYKPGDTYWRVEVTHFTPWDCNWPYGPPEDAIYPNGGPPYADEHTEDDSEESDCLNSYVNRKSRVFHEDISIPGTDMTLHYASNRVRSIITDASGKKKKGTGYRAVITILASGDKVPTSLSYIIVRMSLVGRVYTSILPPKPNQKVTFIWDGLDYRGIPVTGRIVAKIDVGFVYGAVYYKPNALWRAFAAAGRSRGGGGGSSGGASVTTLRARKEIVLWRHYSVELHPSPLLLDDSQKEKLRYHIANGWNLSVHHDMGVRGAFVIIGSNGRVIRSNVTDIIDTIAGTGQAGYSGDGGPATEAFLSYPRGIAMDAAGNLYIADTGNHRIRKVDRNGIITTIAGTGQAGYSGDGGPATEAMLNAPFAVAADNKGNIYIADTGNHRIRKVDRNGIITTVAGNGVEGYSGDNGPAVFASLNSPKDVVINPEGGFYIADSGNSRVRFVDTSGIIRTMAGNGSKGWAGDGGPATDAELCWVRGLALDKDSLLYTVQHCWHRVRRIGVDGIITKVAGNTLGGGYCGDGGPAVESCLREPQAVAVDSDGNVYIADTNNHVIRMINQRGIIYTIVGNRTSGYNGDKRPVSKVKLNRPQDVIVGPDGHLYIADTLNHRIRVVYPSKLVKKLPDNNWIIFSDENGQGYVFDSNGGRHMYTIDLTTGVTLYSFGYDQNGLLVSITDRFGNVTTIQRDASGRPTSITSPDGLVTRLVVDENHNLTRIIYPDGSSYSFVYNPEGYMTDEYDPNGNHFRHVYDENGRVTNVYDPEGGHWSYSKEVDYQGNALTSVLTAEGNLTTYRESHSGSGYTSVKTDPTGSITTYSRSSDRLTESWELPCGMRILKKYSLEPEYKYRYLTELHLITPGGVSQRLTHTRVYQDTNSDGQYELVTDLYNLNSRQWRVDNDILTGTITVASPMGRRLRLEYDNSRLVLTSLSLEGLNPLLFSYDSKGRINSVSAGTRSITVSYDQNGNIDFIITPSGKTFDYTFDLMGRLKEEIRPDGTVVRYEHDANGNITAIVTPTNARHTFTYTGVDQRKIYTTPISGSYQYTYDKERKLKSITFPSGKQIINTYINGLLRSMQTPEGTVNFTYSCSNKLTEAVKGAESLTFTYDGALLTSETYSGTLNETVIYFYKSDFNLSSVSYAGRTYALTYDNDGLLTGMGSFKVSRNALNGLPERVTDGAFAVSRSFNTYAEVDENTYYIGSITYMEAPSVVTVNSRQIKISGSIDNPEDYTVLVNGSDVLVNSDGTFEVMVEFQGDQTVIPIEVRDSLGNTERREITVIYDPSGIGIIKYFAIDPVTEEVYFIDIQSDPAELKKVGSDGLVKRIFTFPAEYTPSTLSFSPSGELYVAGEGATKGSIMRIRSDGTAETVVNGISIIYMAVDSNRNIYGVKGTAGYVDNEGEIYRITPDGSVTLFASMPDAIGGIAVDGGGNLYVSVGIGGFLSYGIYRITPDGTQTLIVKLPEASVYGSITVDKKGDVYVIETDNICTNILKITDNVMSDLINIECRSRLNTKLLFNTELFSNTYDIEFFGGIGVESTGSIIIVGGRGSRILKVNQVGEEVIVEDYIQGQSQGGPEVVKVRINTTGGSVYRWEVTSRDESGRILQRVEEIEGERIVWDYRYDELGRLVEVKRNGTLVEAYTYDANGNRISETNVFKGVTDMAYTYSIEDHLLTAGNDTYQFDPDGFLTEKTTSEGTTTYRYSSRGELLEVTLPNGTIISYDYDPMGRRIAKWINGTIVEKYLWSGRIRLLAVYNGNDNLIMRFNYVDDRVPYSMDFGGQTYYLVYDQIGTLRVVVDSSGLTVKRIDYDSFGNVILDTDPSFRIPIGFAGGLYDSDTRLVRFGVRDYDPYIGRWTAKDPIDFAGGSVNLYEYVLNDPVNWFDPWGLFVVPDKPQKGCPAGVICLDPGPIDPNNFGYFGPMGEDESMEKLEEVMEVIGKHLLEYMFEVITKRPRRFFDTPQQWFFPFEPPPAEACEDK
jgi:RHS repeat-associated protein